MYDRIAYPDIHFYHSDSGVGPVVANLYDGSKDKKDDGCALKEARADEKAD